MDIDAQSCNWISSNLEQSIDETQLISSHLKFSTTPNSSPPIIKLTGPKAANSVTSKTFSIGALFGSGSGGLNNVGRSFREDISFNTHTHTLPLILTARSVKGEKDDRDDI